MTLRAEIRKREPLGGTLFYSRAEYSFRFQSSSPDELRVRIGDSGVTSISIGTLQIEVDIQERCALYVWGLHPHVRWERKSFSPESSIGKGAVHFPELSGLEPGVSLGIAEVGEWVTYFDESAGWVRVTRDEHIDDHVVMVADGVAMGLLDEKLHSVWLRPIFED